MSLLRHSGQYLLARGIPALVNFVALAVYTRLLSPAEYGEFALVLTAVGLGNAVLFRWLNVGIMRFLARYSRDAEKLLSSIGAGFGVIMASSAVLVGLGAWGAPSYVPASLLPAGLVLLWLLGFHELNLSLRNAQLRPLAFGALSTVRSCFALAFGALLAALGQGSAGVVWGVAAGTFVSLVTLTWQDWKDVTLSGVDRGVVRLLLAYGLPLTATFALGMVVSASDRLMLGWLRGAEETGLYAAGYDLPNQALTVVMMIVNLAAYPLAIRAMEEHGPDVAGQRLREQGVLLLAVSVPLGAGMMLLAPQIAGLVLGAEFRAAAATIIPIIALATLLAGLKAYYFDLAFQLAQRTVGQVWVLLPAALLNVLLNIALIPKFGAAGAAWATLAAYAVGSGLSAVYGRRFFAMPVPVTEWLKVALATLVMAAVVWPLRSQLGLASFATAVVIGSVCYLVSALVLNVGGVRDVLKTWSQSRSGRSS